MQNYSKNGDFYTVCSFLSNCYEYMILCIDVSVLADLTYVNR